MLQPRSPAIATACLPLMCMSWPAMASPRLALRLPVAAAGSAAVADRGWVRRGPVPAGAWPASGLAPRSPAPGRSLVPLAGNAAGLRYRGSGGYRRPWPIATTACWPATELRLALALRYVLPDVCLQLVSSLDRTCLSTRWLCTRS